MKRLKSKERKRFLAAVEECYGTSEPLQAYAFYLQEKRQKYYAVTQELDTIDLGDARVDALGLYVGAMHGDEVRLSVEGSQLLGPLATRNVVELDEERFREWMRGEDLDVDDDREGFVIVKHEGDYCGSGRLSGGALKSYLPKTRHTH